MATAHGQWIERPRWEDCPNCGMNGYEAEHNADKIVAHMKAQGEPVVKVQCPGEVKWWHWTNTDIKAAPQFLEMLRYKIDQLKRPNDAFNIRPDVTSPLPKPTAPVVPPKCAKVSYGSELLAKSVLIQAINAGRDEDHAYLCNLCNRWHLTSMKEGDFESPTTDEELVDFGAIKVIACRFKSGGLQSVIIKNGATLRLTSDQVAVLATVFGILSGASVTTSRKPIDLKPGTIPCAMPSSIDRVRGPNKKSAKL